MIHPNDFDYLDESVQVVGKNYFYFVTNIIFTHS